MSEGFKQTQSEQKDDNVVMVGAKRRQIQINGNQKWEYEKSDEKYINAIRTVWDKFDTVVIKGRGHAIQRCVKFATNKQLDNLIDHEKTVVKIGAEDQDKTDKETGENIKVRVEQIEISLTKKQ